MGIEENEIAREERGRWKQEKEGREGRKRAKRSERELIAGIFIAGSETNENSGELWRTLQEKEEKRGE